MENNIIICSNNKGKIQDVKEILKGYTIQSLADIGEDIDIEEDRDTFLGNAIKKAEETAKLINKKCLADDSGIEIEALEGFPGVFTKRWDAGTDTERNLKIIEKLKGMPKEKRKVKFISAIALSDGIKTISVEEVLEGYVAEELKGNNGFGFDEIFELENGKTIAQLTLEEKNEISPRKQAVAKILEKIIEKEEKYI